MVKVFLVHQARNGVTFVHLDDGRKVVLVGRGLRNAHAWRLAGHQLRELEDGFECPAIGDRCVLEKVVGDVCFLVDAAAELLPTLQATAPNKLYK